MSIARLLEGRDRPVITCGADTPVRDAVAMLASERIGALPVMDAGRLAGVFSERDLIYQIAAQGAQVLQRPVRDVMTAPALTVTPDAPILHALSLMTKRRIRHLPVVKDDAMVGLVSIGDLVKHRIDRIESEAEALRAYIQTA